MKKQVVVVLIILLFGLGKGWSQTKKQFAEDPETAVFTTKFVTDDKKLITYVAHDSEGDWQFFSNNVIDDYDAVAKLISLKQIIAIDATVAQLADMKPGYEATRKSKKDKWVIKKSEE